MTQNIPTSCRPREKLINRGASTLTDAELLAIILRTGTKERNVINLAQDLIDQFDGLSGLLNCEFEEIRLIHGLGVAKFCQISAIKEIAKRSLISELQSKSLLDSSETASQFLLTTMSDYKKEVFACLLLDTQNKLLGFEELFSGSINGANIYPREVVKLVLNTNSSAVIFAHNHPSGDTKPSKADIQITKELKQALSLIDVSVLDHIIVGDGTISMAEKGLI
ncbi:MAG: DNA repair protein RadC [Pseudomonadota bacterium]